MEEDILKIQAAAFNALGHPVRLKVLEKLRDGPCCVCKIIPYVGCKQPNVSHHLAILRRAGIIRSEKRGAEVWYDVVDAKIFDLIDIMVDCIIQNLNMSKDILRVLIKERT